MELFLITVLVIILVISILTITWFVTKTPMNSSSSKKENSLRIQEIPKEIPKESVNVDVLIKNLQSEFDKVDIDISTLQQQNNELLSLYSTNKIIEYENYNMIFSELENNKIMARKIHYLEDKIRKLENLEDETFISLLEKIKQLECKINNKIVTKELKLVSSDKTSEFIELCGNDQNTDLFSFNNLSSIEPINNKTVYFNSSALLARCKVNGDNYYLPLLNVI